MCLLSNVTHFTGLNYSADMDECQASNGGCAQICNNTDGSFVCSCMTGYTLAANSLGCDGMTEN